MLSEKADGKMAKAGLLKMKRLKPKNCVICKKEFAPYQSLQRACSIGCAVKWAKEKKEKEEKKKIGRRKKEIRENDLSWWLKKTQEDFNKFIRLRDYGQPCISCGHIGGKVDAGHYRSVGAMRGALRYNELNCHAQCVSCNQHKSSNAIEYRIGLLKKIGAAKVEWLESDHKPVKYTIDELKELRAHYRDQWKFLERELKGLNTKAD